MFDEVCTESTVFYLWPSDRCLFMSSAYSPPLLSNSRCVPAFENIKMTLNIITVFTHVQYAVTFVKSFLTSTIRPLLMTQMRSAPCMVLRRWAIIRTVRPVVALSNASWTTRSDSASNALVASSRIKMLGFLIRARAIAIRCFWPPDRVTPRSPEDLTFLKKNIWKLIHFILGYIFNCSEITLISEKKHFNYLFSDFI